MDQPVIITSPHHGPFEGVYYDGPDKHNPDIRLPGEDDAAFAYRRASIGSYRKMNERFDRIEQAAARLTAKDSQEAHKAICDIPNNKTVNEWLDAARKPLADAIARNLITPTVQS